MTHSVTSHTHGGTHGVGGQHPETGQRRDCAGSVTGYHPEHAGHIGGGSHGVSDQPDQQYPDSDGDTVSEVRRTLYYIGDESETTHTKERTQGRP